MLEGEHRLPRETLLTRIEEILLHKRISLTLPLNDYLNKLTVEADGKKGRDEIKYRTI